MSLSVFNNGGGTASPSLLLTHLFYLQISFYKFMSKIKIEELRRMGARGRVKDNVIENKIIHTSYNITYCKYRY